MKKAICIVAVVMAVLCLLTACNFTSNFSDALGMVKANSTSQAEQMMKALAEKDTEAALALLHPNVSQAGEAAVKQMEDYFNGRKVSALKQVSINTRTVSGTSGKATQESVTFQVTLEDNTAFYISAVYLTDKAGQGFASFQLVLGVV